MNEINKVEHRIPTTQYGYISVYLPLGHSVTQQMVDSLIEDHNTLTEAFKPKEGISEKDFSKFIDNMLLGNNMNLLTTYVQFSEEQKKVAQIIKKSLRRILTSQAKE